MRKTILFRALIIAVVTEVVTLVIRFGFDFQTTRDTSDIIAPLTFGLRIHHSYIGVLIIMISIAFFRSQPRVYVWLLPLGLGVLVSDLFHHFLVLYLTTGNPQFDLVYPGY